MSLRFLVVESESPEDREERRRSAGKSSGETFAATLRQMEPGCAIDRATPSDADAHAMTAETLAGYDAVFVSGSPLHVYCDTPETHRQLDFMRNVFASGTPSFGSCAGLQVATAAAGGTVRKMPHRTENGVGRGIVATPQGRDHPLLAGRPDTSWDALAAHGDEVETLPEGATLLATNRAARVQAAEIRIGDGVFWGVQYHPELSLAEIAAAFRRQADSLIEDGLARSADDVEEQAALFDALDSEPERADLRWRLGVDREVAEEPRRRTELRNFIDHLVRPTREARGR